MLNVEERKMIQIIAVGDTKAPDRVYALCDDGTLWVRGMPDAHFSKSGTAWKQIPNVPSKTIEGEEPLPASKTLE